MKVTRQMLHPDLRAHYRVLSMIPLLGRYRWITQLINRWMGSLAGKPLEGVQSDQVYIPSSDGTHQIRVRVYRPLHHQGKLPAMVYFHGGGYITGNPEAFGEIVKGFMEVRPCLVLVPDYRKAYTQPFPAGFNDCYETLLWARQNAEQLEIVPERFMVAGHSAGGGLTAAVTLKARDTGDVDIAFQMPIYPMIDDRQPSDPARYIVSPVWDTQCNRAGWNAYLADLHKAGSAIPAYAAPARNSDYHGFPPTVTFVGTLEPFYQETVRYVEALRSAGVEVAFKIYEGCVHGFEGLAPKAPVSMEASQFLLDNYADFFDRHVKRSDPE